jgi:4-oxalomesaconate hydratase
MTGRNLLVVSAHAADFVWRAGGLIASATRAGGSVEVLVLSLGARGESAHLWRQEGATLDEVKAKRLEEATAAANVLGARLKVLDLGDYPLLVDERHLEAMAREIRAVRPDYILTHTEKDPYNKDHETAHRVTFVAREMAQADGFDPGTPVIGAPPVFYFEPHQPEMCGFKPMAFIDITPVFDRKLEAMRCMEQGQPHLIDYYVELARRRGVQAVRNSGRKEIVHAEAFEPAHPYVGTFLP